MHIKVRFIHKKIMIALTKLECKRKSRLSDVLLSPVSTVSPVSSLNLKSELPSIGYYYRHPHCLTIGKYPSKTINIQCISVRDATIKNEQSSQSYDYSPFFQTIGQRSILIHPNYAFSTSSLQLYILTISTKLIQVF